MEQLGVAAKALFGRRPAGLLEPPEVAQIHSRLQKVIERGDLAEITHELRRHIHGAADTSPEDSGAST